MGGWSVGRHYFLGQSEQTHVDHAFEKKRNKLIGDRSFLIPYISYFYLNSNYISVTVPIFF